MRKPTDLRLNKKIIIPSAIVIVLLAGFFIFRNVNYHTIKSKSTQIAMDAYRIKDSAAGKRIILRINNVDVTYGQLMCKAKLYDAYSTGSTNQRSHIQSAFDDIYVNIVAAQEVKRKMDASGSNVQPESYDDTVAYMKRVMNGEVNSNSPQISGVAMVQYDHIKDDIDYYRNKRLVDIWLNRFMPSNMISTAGTASYSKKQIQDASAKSQSEAKQILNDSVKSGTILYIDSRYHYLTKALINLS